MFFITQELVWYQWFTKSWWWRKIRFSTCILQFRRYDACINLWRDKLDNVVIDVMSAIFHLPKSFKFESFQIWPSSFINYIVKETSTSVLVMISFESYYENSLKTLTKERQKGDHFSMQYVVIESADLAMYP